MVGASLKDRSVLLNFKYVYNFWYLRYDFFSFPFLSFLHRRYTFRHTNILVTKIDKLDILSNTLYFKGSCTKFKVEQIASNHDIIWIFFKVQNTFSSTLLRKMLIICYLCDMIILSPKKAHLGLSRM